MNEVQVKAYNQDLDLRSKLFGHTLSDDPHIRSAAYRALANFDPDDSIITCLLNGLEDDDIIVRRSAGSVLIEFGYLNARAK